jgi:RHS repeat-associated protein
VEWRYVYDPENRLKEVWRGAERVASFRYDPEGNRVVREIGGIRTVVVDEGYEVRNGVVRKVYRLGGETVAVREGSTVYAAVGDHLGSVTVLAQGGSPAGVTRYLPYGAIRLETGLFPTDRRFTGQRWEQGLGLYDYRARFYDPALGRFLQPDPIVPEPGDPRALNRYAYVYNNPLRYTDLSGHWLETAWDILNIGWDLYEVYRDPRNAWNWVALAADVGAAILPAVPGGVGLVVRGGKAAKAGIEAATHLDEVADVGRVIVEAASHGNEVADAGRVVAEVATHTDEAADVLRGVERAGSEIAENGAKRAAREAQSLIDDIVHTEMKNVRLSQYPQYNPDIPLNIYGRARQNTFTQIGPRAIQEGRGETLITIVHEEMHHRLWARGWQLPRVVEENYLERVAQRFARLKRW